MVGYRKGSLGSSLPGEEGMTVAGGNDHGITHYLPRAKWGRMSMSLDKFFLSVISFSITVLMSTACGGGSPSVTAGGSDNGFAGPLRVSAQNPLYLTDGSGRAIYLTGSHTSANLIDKGATDPPSAFDYNAYLDFLKDHNHNFIRLWTWELSKYTANTDGSFIYAAPLPWSRTGPGVALDGKPKFDLTKFNQPYFDRLRSRLIAAGAQGIYVSIMLFEGWGMFYVQSSWRWDGHPFNMANNINGIDGDQNKDGTGLESHTQSWPGKTGQRHKW